MISFDRLKAGLATFVASCFPRYDFLAKYPGVVVQQSGSNAFDFQPDSPSVPGVSGVPVRFGIPGLSVQLALGQTPRGLLGFMGGDPSQLYIDLWEHPGLQALTVDPAATVNLGPAAAAVGRVGDQVQVTLTALEITGIIAPPSGGPCSGGPITISGTITAGSPKVNA